jgi:hypothetical protein
MGNKAERDLRYSLKGFPISRSSLYNIDFYFAFTRRNMFYKLRLQS